MKSVLVPICALIAAMLLFQLGATFAKGLFPAVGVLGATALRTGLASILLLVWRPWRMRFTRREARTFLIYGLALAGMNLAFYAALQYIPLGIAVAVEFVGPLGVAVAGSRRPIDFLWVALAGLGLLPLLPQGSGSHAISLLGIGYALIAGACWALYIIFGRRAGASHGGAPTALGMLINAIIMVPLGLYANGLLLFSAELLPTACVVALLSALPYSLEMLAMPKLPARTVGVLMSLEPALGALVGLIVLGERLSAVQWLAVAAIMAASAGCTLSERAPREAQISPN